MIHALAEAGKSINTAVAKNNKKKNNAEVNFRVVLFYILPNARSSGHYIFLPALNTKSLHSSLKIWHFPEKAADTD